MAGEVFTKKYMYIGGGEGGEWEGGGGIYAKSHGHKYQTTVATE